MRPLLPLALLFAVSGPCAAQDVADAGARAESLESQVQADLEKAISRSILVQARGEVLETSARRAEAWWSKRRVGSEEAYVEATMKQAGAPDCPEETSWNALNRCCEGTGPDADTCIAPTSAPPPDLEAARKERDDAKKSFEAVGAIKQKARRLNDAISNDRTSLILVDRCVRGRIEDLGAELDAAKTDDDRANAFRSASHDYENAGMRIEKELGAIEKHASQVDRLARRADLKLEERKVKAEAEELSKSRADSVSSQGYAMRGEKTEDANTRIAQEACRKIFSGSAP